MEIVLASSTEVPAFWFAPSVAAEVINGHCGFVQNAKLLVAHRDREAQEAICDANPFVQMQCWIPPLQDNLGPGESLDSAKLKITSPHPLAMDEGSVIAGEAISKKQQLERMFVAGKRSSAVQAAAEQAGVVWDTGLITVGDLASAPPDLIALVQDMRAQGSFVRLSENAIISNMVTEPRYFFVDQEHSCTIVLPKITFGFRMLWDSFTFGQVNIVPHWEAVRPGGGARVLMGGLTFARAKTGSSGSSA